MSTTLARLSSLVSPNACMITVIGPFSCESRSVRTRYTKPRDLKEQWYFFELGVPNAQLTLDLSPLADVHCPYESTL